MPNDIAQTGQRVNIDIHNYVTGCGKTQHFADSIKVDVLLYLASAMSELHVG